MSRFPGRCSFSYRKACEHRPDGKASGHGSLCGYGSLREHGSLRGHHTLRGHGSLQRHDCLWEHGSLQRHGCLWEHGSLRGLLYKASPGNPTQLLFSLWDFSFSIWVPLPPYFPQCGETARSSCLKEIPGDNDRRQLWPGKQP